VFDRTSRYANLPVATYRSKDREVLYVRRRMLPPLRNDATVKSIAVVPGQRLDNVAAAAIGDPTQFWRITDVNDVLDPFDLSSTPGGRILVPIAAATSTTS
jgi:hypothetical protein